MEMQVCLGLNYPRTVTGNIFVQAVWRREGFRHQMYCIHRRISNCEEDHVVCFCWNYLVHPLPPTPLTYYRETDTSFFSLSFSSLCGAGLNFAFIYQLLIGWWRMEPILMEKNVQVFCTHYSFISTKKGGVEGIRQEGGRENQCCGSGSVEPGFFGPPGSAKK